MITNKLKRNVRHTCEGKMPADIWAAMHQPPVDDELRELLSAELDRALKRSPFKVKRSDFEKLMRMG